MRRLIILLLLPALQTTAQYSVRFVVTASATRFNEDIYLSGNFNNWNPKDENYKLKPFGGSRKSIVLKDVAAGTYAFKFTRGSTASFESTADGRDIADRVVEVTGDVSNEFTIAGWKDDYPEKPKRYTASTQVRIIDTAFNIPQLNRKRRIWVYLPKNYASVGRAFPVLYMHDGQNLFNEQTAYAGEWGIDECLDTLQAKLGKECIVVGIDNGGEKRMQEYNPYDHVQYGKGEGAAYVDFIAKTLKPFIDAKYRTRKGADYTYIAGSSMGGLISWYAMIKYPDIFGGAGIFSPSFWVSPQVAVDATMYKTSTKPRFYFYVGQKESPTMQPDMEKIVQIFKKQPQYDIRTVINPLGEHKERYWREEFPSFYKWMSINW